MNHDEAVTKHYLAAENSLEEGYWDDVFRETTYFEGQEAPVGPRPDDHGNCVGEFDVICVNYDDKLALYKEIKTGYGDLSYADEQLQRAEDYFEDTDWDVIGKKVLEN